MAGFECLCGHGRSRHSGPPERRGGCRTCTCAEYVYAAEAVARSRMPAATPPQEEREPHPSCPLQDPDCIGFHPTIGW
ncbi:hypothetical protein ACFRCG_01965 [Embleya sp. NPDC056575]|uniref:hypothetical protein n=1 Tax=Embleya sp. NPDC056575 TaxID=3345869 RepID=UPI0036A4E7D6